MSVKVQSNHIDTRVSRTRRRYVVLCKALEHLVSRRAPTDELERGLVGASFQYLVYMQNLEAQKEAHEGSTEGQAL